MNVAHKLLEAIAKLGESATDGKAPAGAEGDVARTFASLLKGAHASGGKHHKDEPESGGHAESPAFSPEIAAAAVVMPAAPAALPTGAFGLANGAGSARASGGRDGGDAGARPQTSDVRSLLDALDPSRDPDPAAGSDLAAANSSPDPLTLAAAKGAEDLSGLASATRPTASRPVPPAAGVLARAPAAIATTAPSDDGPEPQPAIHTPEVELTGRASAAPAFPQGAASASPANADPRAHAPAQPSSSKFDKAPTDQAVRDAAAPGAPSQPSTDHGTRPSPRTSPDRPSDGATDAPAAGPGMRSVPLGAVHTLPNAAGDAKPVTLVNDSAVSPKATQPDATPAHAAAESVVNQAVLRRVASGEIHVPELGRVAVRAGSAAGAGGAVNVEVSVDRPETHAILHASAGAMAADLRQADVPLGHLRFERAGAQTTATADSGGGQGGTAHDLPRNSHPSPERDETDEPSPAPAASRVRIVL